MSRYTTRKASSTTDHLAPSRTAWIADPLTEDDYASNHVPTVCDHEAVPTGLLDQNGDEIWREPNPIGFVWPD